MIAAYCRAALTMMTRRFANRILFLAVIAGVCAMAPSRAADDAGVDSLVVLVELLGSNDDPQFQLDLLKGMSDGLKGRREVKMPAGWEAVAEKLAKSPNAR